MKVGVVIPVGAGREENLGRCLVSIEDMEVKPDRVVLVCDGPEAYVKDAGEVNVLALARKHEPGMEQPRNAGVRFLKELDPEITHVWFLDTDILLDPWALSYYHQAMEVDETPRILVGPYDWLPPGVHEIDPNLRNDPRWPSFTNHDENETLTNDLSAGLACFGGNLIWPIEEFEKIGGFWNEINHGRCEDGELGLRAVACGIPITFVPNARGWHMDHEINGMLTIQRNERDVPMINERHPWVEGEDVFVVEEDGRRFNVRCACGWEGNTMEIWAHQATCEEAR